LTQACPLTGDIVGRAISDIVLPNWFLPVSEHPFTTKDRYVITRLFGEPVDGTLKCTFVGLLDHGVASGFAECDEGTDDLDDFRLTASCKDDPPDPTQLPPLTCEGKLFRR